MTITYLYNSGFTVQMDRHLLIFDPVDNRFAPDPSQPPIVFVSHAHTDHYDPIVEAWRAEKKITLITGYDVSSGGIAMRPGETIQVNDLSISAYGSTDEGVCFLVRAEGCVVFHAGDFNLWHWRDESTEEEIAEAEAGFARVLDSLKGQSIDVAFFPVDPRMGTAYDEGARIFAQAIAPALLIPMHFREDAWAARAFEASLNGQEIKTRVKALTKPGETYTV